MNGKGTGIAALGLGAVLLLGACAAPSDTESIREAGAPAPAASQGLRDCSDVPKEPKANLSHCDLIGSDLSGAKLWAANLTGANLFRADLTGADLTRADLSGAYLSWADLRGASLGGVNLSGANLSGASLTGASLTGATWIDGRMCGHGSSGMCR
ncbi:MAG: pentapeptide repeat-containing protein [Candidatus Nanopelagicales bacterium]|nr:pentapeptide repeat-containing protein [Candidatus Nanopelagicales bacterium]MDZ4248591.1 pentapeptide repeat-containing protein [Candidatus Nanopelagicales bacterium]